MKINEKNKSTLTYVLLAFMPYTTPNMMLAFKPNLFFNELEKISGHSSTSLRMAFKRAEKRKLLSVENNTIRLSLEARHIVHPFIAKKLVGGGQLMVIFDIPEDFANVRRKFRFVLRQLEFKQVQQSVWMSGNDYRSIISETIDEMGLHNWVQLYESARIK